MVRKTEDYGYTNNSVSTEWSIMVFFPLFLLLTLVQMPPTPIHFHERNIIVYKGGVYKSFFHIFQYFIMRINGGRESAV